MTMLSSHIVCVSDAVKNHVLKMTHARLSKVSTIYNGINLQQYPAVLSGQARCELCNQFGIKKNAFVIGFISRVTPGKGHEYFIRAITRVIAHSNNAYFLVVGDGPAREEMAELARQRGVEKHVFFTGTRIDIPEILALMDVFVYPPMYEAFGLSVIEAMAAGKPVIAAHSEVMPELITHDTNGLIIPIHNADAIADAIIDLYDNPGKRAAFSRAAMEKAKSFSIEKTAHTLETLYHSLLDKQSQ